MAISRRDFLKLSGGTAVAAGAASLGLTPEEAAAKEMELRTKGAKETKTICPYCAVGCGIVVHTKTERSSTLKATRTIQSAKEPFARKEHRSIR